MCKDHFVIFIHTQSNFTDGLLTCRWCPCLVCCNHYHRNMRISWSICLHLKAQHFPFQSHTQKRWKKQTLRKDIRQLSWSRKLIPGQSASLHAWNNAECICQVHHLMPATRDAGLPICNWLHSAIYNAPPLKQSKQ